MTGSSQPVAQRARPGLLPRSYNYVMRQLYGRRELPPSLDLDDLQREAEHRTGLRFGSEMRGSFCEAAFRNAIEASCAGGGLTPFARVVVRQTVLRSLGNKLRMEALIRRRPSLCERPVRSPIMIVGLFRSGTTLLHRRLAEHPALRAPRAWELYLPIPGGSALDARTRRGRVALELRIGKLAVPELELVHSIEADSYEESAFLLQTEGVMFSAIFGFGGLDHGTWLLGRDLGPAYRTLGRQLQILATHGDEHDPRRWLLKCPLTTWHMDDFLRVFPDASVIQLHRALDESVASACSFCTVLQRGSRQLTDPRHIGSFLSEYYLTGLERALLARRRWPRARFLDIGYEQLTGDTNATVSEILRWLGLPTAGLGSRRGARPGHAGSHRSSHQYSLEQFGLDREHLRARLDAIYQRLGHRPAVATPLAHGCRG